MHNQGINFSRIFIEMITYRQCTLCVAYHSLLEAPLDLEALGLSLYSLLVDSALPGSAAHLFPREDDDIARFETGASRKTRRTSKQSNRVKSHHRPFGIFKHAANLQAHVALSPETRRQPSNHSNYKEETNRHRSVSGTQPTNTACDRRNLWGAVCKNIISDRFSTKTAISGRDSYLCMQRCYLWQR